jgi:hypothetical protein
LHLTISPKCAWSCQLLFNFYFKVIQLLFINCYSMIYAPQLQLDLAELERQFPDSSSSSGKKGKPKKPTAKSKPASKGSSKAGSAAASMDESSGNGTAAAAKNGNGSSNGSAAATVSVDKTYEEPDPVPAGEGLCMLGEAGSGSWCCVPLEWLHTLQSCKSTCHLQWLW